MSENLLKQARDHRDLVLLAELAGWLHDLGKLSQRFVEEHLEMASSTSDESESAEAGPEQTDGGTSKKQEQWLHQRIFSKLDREDRHDQSDYAYLAERYERLLTLLNQRLTGAGGWLESTEPRLGSDRVGLAALVFGHHGIDWRQLEPIQRLLNHADDADSGEDEYNAVASQKGIVQAATVFGTESALCDGDLADLDKQRRALYEPLSEQLGRILTGRDQLWDSIRSALCQGLGKTQRAANDVRLDQHAWGVATRFKTFVLRDLIKEATGNKIDYQFRLLSVCWDSWAQITPFARLSDVVGRKAMLDDLRKRLRCLVEDKYALGNCIYEDDDGIHFMVADVEWGSELEDLLRDEVDRCTDGEVQPNIELSESTPWVTDLVGLMQQARTQTPLIGRPRWLDAWKDLPNREVCPVCRKRPLEAGQELCTQCATWRYRGLGARLARGTVWNGEIAGAGGRVALIVARFDLERWLNGDMLHASFITSPQDIVAGTQAVGGETWNWAYLRAMIAQYDQAVRAQQELGQQRVQQRNLQRERERVQNKLESDTANQRIPAEIKTRLLDESRSRLIEIDQQLANIAAEMQALDLRLAQMPSEMARFAAYMDGKPGQKERVQEMTKRITSLYGSTPDDAFLLALARKNPSAARLLRVWQKTEEFLQDREKAIYRGAKQQERVVWALDRPAPAGIYRAEAPGGESFEVFVRPQENDRSCQAISIEHLDAGDLARLQQLSHLRLTSAEQAAAFDGSCTIRERGTESYAACQVIGASPNLLLALVPAGQGMDVARAMHEAYVEEFGKVQGRLPFHVGLIYMDAHYPMFAALDTARRMAESFDRLSGRPRTGELVETSCRDGVCHLALESDRFGAWTWQVPYLRGDGETDWYHPYFLVKQGEGLAERGMSIAGPYGRWVHVKQLRPGDTVAFWPNLFDFLYVDTVTRRFDAQVPPETDRRPHSLLGQAHSPRPYLLERAAELDATWEAICRVKGITETRLAAVESLLGQKWQAWQLADADPLPETWTWLVRQTVARDLDGKGELEAAIGDGRFFDAVELYRHILKQPVKSQQDKEAT